MAKIIAPNEQYNGISASVRFVQGVGETDNPHLIKWFEDHRYTVEDKEVVPPSNVDEFTGKSVDELKAYAEEHGIDIGNATSEKGIIKKIQEAREAKTE